MTDGPAPVAFLLLACACNITHVDPPPLPSFPADYKEVAIWQHAQPEKSDVPDEWWTLFQDPVLNALENRLVIGNENLKQSAGQVSVARAQAAASRQALFPTLGAGEQGVKPDDTGNSRGRGHAGVAFILESTWEIDLWGRLREARDAAKATLQATADDAAAARLSARSLLAQNYFSMRAADVQLQLLDRSVEAYRRSRQLTQYRYEDGVAARRDVLEAENQLNTTQAQLADVTASRAQLEHSIAVLLGLPPSMLTIARSPQLPDVPPVPRMIPSTLLERRPDIAAAERRVAAAYSQIGVARAAYYPQLSLSAGIGLAVNSLVDAPSFVYSIGPQIAEIIFDNGARKVANIQADVGARQATSNYRQTVLTALQEVEDNLTLADQLGQEATFQQEALAASQHQLDIVRDQYQAGFASSLDVIVAQTGAINSQIAMLQVKDRQLAAVNVLLKNIAGRWEVDWRESAQAPVGIADAGVKPSPAPAPRPASD